MRARTGQFHLHLVGLGLVAACDRAEAGVVGIRGEIIDLGAQTEIRVMPAGLAFCSTRRRRPS